MDSHLFIAKHAEFTIDVCKKNKYMIKYICGEIYEVKKNNKIK